MYRHLDTWKKIMSENEQARLQRLAEPRRTPEDFARIKAGILALAIGEQPAPEQKLRRHIVTQVENTPADEDIRDVMLTPYLLVKILDRLEAIEALLAGIEAPIEQEDAPESPFLGRGE